MAEKELLSNDTILKLTRYVTSFDDVIRGQNLDTFMHNPLNVYKIIRHAVVGWPIVERSLKVVEIFSRLLIFHLNVNIVIMINYEMLFLTEKTFKS